MIRTFQILNFKSIMDLTASFTYAEGRAPGNWREGETLPFLQNDTDTTDRYVPVLAIYGPNASGKSNLIEAFAVFQKILTHGIRNLYLPNKLLSSPSPTKFIAHMIIDHHEYSYSLEYNQNEIIRENLSQILQHSKSITLFQIEKDSEPQLHSLVTEDCPASRLIDTFHKECFNAHGFWSTPFLSCLANFFSELSSISSAIWIEWTNKLRISRKNTFLLSEALTLLSPEDSPEAPQKATDQVLKLLRKFDLEMEDLQITRTLISPDGTASFSNRSEDHLSAHSPITGSPAYLSEIKSFHKNDQGDLIPFDFLTEESEGTKLLAGLVATALWALKNGKMLMIDKLDRSLHPFVLINLIKLFKSKRYNKTNAQLIFSLHDPTPLDENLLRVSEVAIIDKTQKSGTTFTRISDFPDSRNVFNFRKQYLEGAFSGIPFPYI